MANDIFDRIPNEVKYSDLYLLPEGIKILQGNFETHNYYLNNIYDNIS